MIYYLPEYCDIAKALQGDYPSAHDKGQGSYSKYFIISRCI
ncbi:hypothetical protein [Butyrivibrio sp. XPD2002]|nr:hypothetical protein [Butyrivibrio sp. XPD2002]